MTARRDQEPGVVQDGASCPPAPHPGASRRRPPGRGESKHEEPFDADAQRRKIVAALEANDGCVAHAAADLDLARQYFSELLRRHDLQGFAADLRQKAWGRKRGRPPESY